MKDIELLIVFLWGILAGTFIHQLFSPNGEKEENSEREDN